MSHTITLTNLAKASEQRVFNQAVRHLLTQNKRCFNKAKTCQYLNDKGLKCVAGCFISKQQHKDLIDGINSRLNSETWSFLVKSKIAPIEHMEFIEELQYIHDNLEPRFWYKELNILAKKRNLNTVELNKFKKVK